MVLILAAIVSVSLSEGCISPHHAVSTDVDARAWSEPAVITLSNSDTTTLRDMALFLRCNDLFTEDTLTVRISVCTPDSLRHEESFLLTIPPGHTPAAVAREIDIPYRRRIIFTRTGDYRVTITPARTVKGIEAIGINTDKTE
ncbi:hypothetical protein [uncultured Alistipes sp.]|jgi:hypothetical protein|uniref:hypothetical protein n=1 Tax=uncultured Alistipes sp. TaxID=538949 RepID=UPI0025F58BE2|nr:hypothetical protein [uncultured Alistipes sp.]